MDTTQEKINVPIEYPFDFQGLRVFVVGGGTSLKDFDFHRLQNCLVIGANMAAIVAEASVLVSIDHNFIQNYHDEISEFVALGGAAVLGRKSYHNLDRVAAVPGAIETRHLREGVIDPPEWCLAGPNSGFAALGLAVQSRALQINLLGFDMCGGQHGKHFFGPYRHGTSSPSSMSNWWRTFHETAADIDRLGIDVVNWVGNPTSRIQCFRTRPLEEIECIL